MIRPPKSEMKNTTAWGSTTYHKNQSIDGMVRKAKVTLVEEDDVFKIYIGETPMDSLYQGMEDFTPFFDAYERIRPIWEFSTKNVIYPGIRYPHKFLAYMGFDMDSNGSMHLSLYKKGGEEGPDPYYYSARYYVLDVKVAMTNLESADLTRLTAYHRMVEDAEELAKECSDSVFSKEELEKKEKYRISGSTTTQYGS